MSARIFAIGAGTPSTVIGGEVDTWAQAQAGVTGVLKRVFGYSNRFQFKTREYDYKGILRTKLTVALSDSNVSASIRVCGEGKRSSYEMPFSGPQQPHTSKCDFVVVNQTYNRVNTQAGLDMMQADIQAKWDRIRRV